MRRDETCWSGELETGDGGSGGYNNKKDNLILSAVFQYKETKPQTLNKNASHLNIILITHHSVDKCPSKVEISLQQIKLTETVLLTQLVT